MPGYAGVSGAPRAVWPGFGAAFGHGRVYSPVVEVVQDVAMNLQPDELAGGLVPLSHPHSEHPAAPSAPPQFRGTGNGRGRRAADVLGSRGSCGAFCLLVLQCLTMGQVPRVVPGYLELSFLSVKKKKRNRMLLQRKMLLHFRRAVLL